MQTLKINCETKDTLPLDELTEFQGGLKKRDDEDVRKIVDSIRTYGFCYPFFIWKHDGINHVLDGHGRLLGLRRLDELGFIIPDLPVVYVHCDNETAAKDLLLRLNSNYGKMSKESVLEFIGDDVLDMDNFVLPESSINFDEITENPLDLIGADDEKEEKFELVVTCESLEDEKQIYERLLNLGLNVRTKG